ncbi:aldo/keto reductase [Rhizobium bangladeshense]|uniref:Aldo/keto reductase n=1 Tax=Rhizobium bangladeshense TaxID=1138189 RepID=A0ABS7LP55_9HYPH|nr:MULTISPECIES: aldo/keto reductase [Rhizobium]MBX4867462.1 aldo/keto reductase [Rhizobium bangladeshense]MBX4871755.1 aldo/keto reductase [Rhizobium bangladeshense]MBX4883069.1 aldo/keto reductase [Rhizobium bangladeshense]MBY3593060.1 aldo/keto reductase [Rhizobium bangladeshense]MBY3595634.1 aldo/keto reductase [Rhizobium bangladeshense]
MKTRHWDRRGDGGLTFTELGFGTAPLGNLYRAITDEEAAAVLDAAWQHGIRYFDTAPLYGLGLAERRVGRFLATKQRNDFVISTKVGRLLKVCRPEQRTGIGKFFGTPNRREVFDYSYDGVMRSFEASFERTGLDSFDILFVHDLDVFNHGTQAACDHYVEQFMNGGYQAMTSLRDQGVVKAVGGGINEWEMCQTLAERCNFDLFLLAGRYTLLEQQALESFLPLCAARNIGIVLGGPYNSGILATGPVAGAQYNYSDAPLHILDKVRRIEEVCLKYNVALSDAALNFPFFHPAVVSVIPGGQSIDQVASNHRGRNRHIPRKLWEDLKSLGLMRDDAPVSETESHGER